MHIKNLILLLLIITSRTLFAQDVKIESDLVSFSLCERQVKVTMIKKSEFEDLISPIEIKDESKYLKEDSLKVIRLNDTLVFNLNNGKKAHLINDDSNGERYGQYSYLGTLDNLNQFIVYGSFWEWHNYILIDMESGDTNYLAGFPVLSPDKKTIISGNCDLIAGYTFNGLELYNNSSPIKKICSTELMSWGPDKIKWIDDSSLIIKGYISDTSLDNLQKLEYFRIEWK
tara:strand:- start:379 stop:1065 length:687 start_codon:yes stop_codon:yes gene_type:complete